MTLFKTYKPISSKLYVRNMIKIQLCAVHSKLHDSLNVKDSTIHFKKIGLCLYSVPMWIVEDMKE